MSVRSLSLSLLLAAVAVPAVGQAPESAPAPRPRSTLRFNSRIGELPFRFNRMPRMDLERIRMRALDRALRVRREMGNRGFDMRLRAETRLKFRQPLVRRRHFRDI